MTLTELGLPEFEVVKEDQKYVFKNYTLLAYDLKTQWRHYCGFPSHAEYTREGVNFRGLFETKNGLYIILEHDKSRAKRCFLQEEYRGYTSVTQVYSEFPWGEYQNMEVRTVQKVRKIKEVE